MRRTQCSKRTAQLAITQASQEGLILQDDGQYHLPLVGDAQAEQRDRVKRKWALQTCNLPRDSLVGLIRAD